MQEKIESTFKATHVNKKRLREVPVNLPRPSLVDAMPLTGVFVICALALITSIGLYFTFLARFKILKLLRGDSSREL